MFDTGHTDLTPAYLALGSNVGARETNVLRAAAALERYGAPIVKLSSLYETEPVGCGPMRAFVNAVAQVLPLLPAGDLLQRLKDLERDMGRSGSHNEPREIDIDIVSLGSVIVQSVELTVPHRRYSERLFVLVPLREIAPDFTCPSSGRSIDAMLCAAADSGAVELISGRTGSAKSRCAPDQYCESRSRHARHPRGGLRSEV
jgi:2-amino-4-hydroxy-6-hydroxymethyldihydropteridine diphosphokinase